MFKRRVAGVLAVAMCMSLVGCGGGNDSSTSDTKDSSESEAAESEDESTDESEETAALSGTVEFANDKLAGTDVAFLDEFTGLIEEATGLGVEFNSYPDTASYQTYIQQTIREADAPGLMTWWSGSQYETLAEEGVLTDLTEFWDEYLIPAGLPEGARDELTCDDGKVYAAPYLLTYTSVMYNMDVFEDAGVEIPETLDEFMAACDALLEKGYTPIGLKDESWGGFLWFQQVMCMKDPQLFLDVCSGEKAYTDPEVVEALKVWEDMLNKGYFSKPMNYADCENMMANGEIAMILEDNGGIARVVDNYGMVSGENLGRFSIPCATGEKVIFFEVAPLCVPAASDEKDLALEMLKNYYDPSVQEAFNKQTGFFTTSSIEVEDPVQASILEDVADTENYTLLLRYYEATPNEIRDVALDEFMKLQLGNATVEEITATIQAKADEVWAQQ